MATSLTYQEVLEQYKRLPRKESLADWAAKMNQLTGADRYTAATQDPLRIKRASAEIDRLLERTAIPASTEMFGRQIGEAIGDPEAGARVGKTLPRMALNFAPLLIPGGGVAGAVAKFGATAALSGAEAYTATGSPTAGILAGATALAMPPAASITTRLARQYALEKFGGRLVKGPVADAAGNVLTRAKEYFPTTLGQRVGARAVGETAGQVVASAVGQAGTTTTELATGQPVTSPFTTENLLAQTLGQVPFAGIQATRSLVGARKAAGGRTPMEQADLLQNLIDESAPRIAAREAREAQLKQPDVSKVPEVKQPDEVPPEVVTATQATLERIRGRQLDIKNDSNLSEAEKYKLLNDESEREAEVLRKKQRVPGTIFGNTITAEQPRQEIVGRQVWVNKTGTYRRVLVAEDPLNPPELWNQVIGYSTKNEPPPTFGLQTQETQLGPGQTGLGRFSLPDPQWQTAPKPAFAYFEKKTTAAKKMTAAQVEAERAQFPEGINPIVKPLVDALNGKDVITTGSDERTVKVQNAFVDESKLPPGWKYDPETGAISKSATVTDQGPLRPDEIQPIVNAVTAQPRPKITIGRAEGQPDLPVREVPMSTEELNANLHEIEKITQAAVNAETPLDLQRATVELNAVEGDNDMPLTDDTTLRPLIEQIDKEDMIDPNQAPKAAVVVAGKQAARKLKAKQAQLAKLEAEWAAETPVTFETLPSEQERREIAETAAMMGATEGQPGFKVTDLTHLSHLSDDAQFQDIAAEVAYEAVAQGESGRTAFKAFEGWTGKEETTLVKDATTFYDITGNFDVAKLPYDEVAKFLNDRAGLGLTTWNEHEVAFFMIRPHVQIWLKAMDANLGQKKQANAAFIAAETPGGGFEERLVRPAVQTIEGKIFVGGLHADAWERAGSPEGGNYTDGWVTNTGRFLTKDAAAKEFPTSFDPVAADEVGSSDAWRGADVVESLTPQEEAGQTSWTPEQMGEISPVPGAKRVVPRWESDKPYVLTGAYEVRTATEMGFDSATGASTGRNLNNFLANSQNSFYRALGRDLAKFSDLLDRVVVRLVDTDGSYARQLRDGKVEVSIAGNVLNGHSDTQAFTVAHELVHGLTIHEIDNPLKVLTVRKLDRLRDRLIEKLPGQFKKNFLALQEQGWYARYANGEVVSDMNVALGLTDKKAMTNREQEILYGLMTTKEMVSQGLTQGELRAFMQVVKPKEGGTWYHRFAQTVKELIGLGEQIDDTSFEEFLSHTDQLLEQGEHVASFKNYSERYFERLGMGEQQVLMNTKRAMGLVNDSIFGTEPDALLTQLRFGGLVGNAEITTTHRDMLRMFQERGDDFATTASIFDEHGYIPSDFEVGRIGHEIMLNNLPNYGDVLDTLPPAVTNHIFALARDAKQVLGAIQSGTRDANKGMLNIADPKLVSGPVAKTIKMLDNVLAFEKKQRDAQQVVDAWEGIPPSGHLTNVVQNPEVIPQWVTGADKTKTKENWLRYTFEPIAQWARRVPEVAEVVAKGWQLGANSRKMASEALKAFGTDLTTMDLSHASVKMVANVLKIPKLTKAVDQWLWTNQLTGREANAVGMLDADHPEIKKILDPLSVPEREQVEELVQKHQISQQQMQAQILEKMLQIASTRGAEIAGGPVREGVKKASILLDALRADRNDPVAARAADAQIDMVQKGMQPQEFLNLLKYSEAVIGEWKDTRDFYQKNPAWSSGQRYGKFLVTYMRGKKVFLAGVDSKKEAEALAKGAKIVKFEQNRKADPDAPPNLGPDSVGMITKLRAYQQTQYDMMLNSGRFTQEDIANMRTSSPVEAFATEEAYRGGVPGLTPQPRGLTKGAEELPWLRNHFSWVRKTSTYWSRQLLRSQVHAHLLDPEIASNPELQAKLKTHFDNMLTPDAPVGHFFQRATMNWFMGFNPASAMVNATQPFMTHAAEFTAMTGKPVDSYRRTIGALKDVAKYFASGKKSWGDADVDWAMHKAHQDGEIDLAMYDDQAAAQEAVHTNYKRIMDGQRVQTLGQHLGTAAGAVTKAGMWMFRGVERTNTMAALLSSFRYYKEQGFNREAALEKAYQFNHAVNFGGGGAARPVGIFAGRGVVPRTAAMLATSMQSYVLGTTFQLGRYIQQGYFRPEGLTPGEVYGARKAAVQMLSVQLASAGVLGLPFVSGAIAALNAMFPDLEVRRHLQEWMDELLGSDKENGSILSDAAMTGVPSMFGWDLQSRLSMGNTVPGVSEVNGFDPKLLMGAPANMVINFVKGGQKLTQGDVSAIDQFTPPALKKISQWARQGGVATDYRDRPIFTPSKGEVAGMALGFQPKRLTDFNTASRIAKQAQDNISRRRGEFHQQMGGEVLKGNFGNVRAELQRRMQEDPNFDAMSAARSIAQAAEALTFPRDLRREGTVAAGDVRARLLRSFNIPPTQPDETRRLQFRQGVEQRLGLPVSTGNDLLLAQVMDQLRRQNPGASRSDLRRQAERLLRGPRLQTLALPQE